MTPAPYPFLIAARLAAVVLLALLGTSRLAAVGGAGSPEIDENLVTATLYVAASGGNDAGPGTQAQPLATIAQALSRYSAGVGGYRVVLLPGVHRPGAAGADYAIELPTIFPTRPLILEGHGWSPGTHTGDVVVSGSENWSGGWGIAGTENGRTAWEADWPYDWGLSPNIFEPLITPPDAVRTYHLVHVDGATYYEVLGPADPTIANLAANEGYFYVNEASDFIRVAPPASVTDLNTRLVEVSTRRILLRFFRLSSNTSPTPLAVRNLTFRHAAPGLAMAAVRLQNMNGAIVEDCRMENSKNSGLILGGSGSTATYTARRCVVIGNGTTGAGFQATNAVVANSVFAGNGRQADVSQYTGWDYGGFKLGESRNVTLRGLVVENNYGVGMWLDTGNRAILVTDCISQGNTTTGMFIENNNRNTITGLGAATTVEVRRTVLRDNRQTSPQNPVTGRGLYIAESENVIVDACLVYGNTQQVRIADGNSRGPIANIRLANSAFVCTEPGQTLIAAPQSTSWGEFISTYSALSDFNRWHRPESTIAFPDASRAVTLDLAGWRTLVGAEAGSVWSPVIGRLMRVILETSTDGQTWVPAEPGAFDSAGGTRTYRVRLEPE